MTHEERKMMGARAKKLLKAPGGSTAAETSRELKKGGKAVDG
jgi:hypothetical protein